MSIQMPAISLSALPGRRHKIIEFAKESEDRGFAGIYLPSLGDNMALATAIGWATKRIVFGTSICPIYFRSTLDLAQAAALRFAFRPDAPSLLFPLLVLARTIAKSV